MATALNVLQTTRINAIMQGLVDVRTMPQQLLFLRRTPIVPAVDSEVMGRFIGYVTVADIIADDQKAVTYQNEKLQIESTAIPNLKHGTPMTQEMLNQLNAINSYGALQNDQGIFSEWENRLIMNLLVGIQQRMEMLIACMQTDAFSYNRYGIVINNASWGMPAGLKVTAGTAWSNTGATPVTDLLTLKRYATVVYGETYNRATMSTPTFLGMLATTEFQNRAKYYLPQGLTGAQLPTQDTETMRNIARDVLGNMEIELYDARFWQRNTDGTLASYPYLPINKVVLSDTADDNDPNAMDFANSIVTESLVSSLLSDSMAYGGFGGPTRGPVAYATPAAADLNPPGINYWGVARGFPRKKRLQATAVIDSGVTVDPIPTAVVPF